MMQTIKKVTSWLSDSLLSFLPDDAITTSSEINYEHLDGNYYTNNSNQVLNLEAGRVIEIGSDGKHVIVLSKRVWRLLIVKLIM